jgi:hypothetical protein
MKQTVNASVLTMSTDSAFPFSFTMQSPSADLMCEL